MTSSEGNVCSICQLPFTEFGNNAWPINKGRCCDECNATVVIPARLNQMRRHNSLRIVQTNKE